jgi:hypothetical protein
MTPVEQSELNAITEDRRCRGARVHALATLSQRGTRHPTLAEYEHLTDVLESRKQAQSRLDDFHAARSVPPRRPGGTQGVSPATPSLRAK